MKTIVRDHRTAKVKSEGIERVSENDVLPNWKEIVSAYEELEDEERDFQDNSGKSRIGGY